MKTFPILPPSASDVARLAAAGIAQPKAIPWAMIAPCAERAAKNHGGQSLEQLAEHGGGLDAGEIVAVLRDWSFQLMTVEASYMQLGADLSHWLAAYGDGEEEEAS